MSLKKKINQEILEKIINSVNELEFGSVQITVHDSQITQIEKVEKHRFPLPKRKIAKEEPKNK